MIADHELKRRQHDHTFGQDQRRPGERRTLIVIALTATTMIVEITAGIAFGSMALLADGLHMASHAVALGINGFAYMYARRHATDRRFSFGTGKVNAIGGYTGAVLLAVFALIMAWESVERFISPVAIHFNHAILVAVLGLVINGLSVLILGGHDTSDERSRAHESHHGHHHSHHHTHHHDHNLKSAYLHVLADALTSLLAILALVAGKYIGLVWMDPAMGIVGSVLVARWSVGLLRSTGHVLLDHQASKAMRQAITESIESDGNSIVTDLHVWAIGVDVYSVVMTIVTHHPATPDEYRARLPHDFGLSHVSIEVHPSVTSDVQ